MLSDQVTVSAVLEFAVATTLADAAGIGGVVTCAVADMGDRKSTRLNSSHLVISYAVFFFNDTATTEIYTLSLHDALPISVLEFAVATTLADAAGIGGVVTCAVADM